VKPLHQPDISLLNILDTCASSYRDVGLKTRCLNTAPQLLGHQSELEDRISNHRLLDLSTSYGTEQIAAKEAEGLYTDKLAKKKAPGRRFYDRIINREELSFCPYCGLGYITTLDHFVPKSDFPYLAISPTNLVPCCSDCNKSKGTHKPSSKEQVLFNPYFESFDYEWLHVELFSHHELIARYQLSTKQAINSLKQKRLEEHFQVFDLGIRYRTYAINEVVSGKNRWRKLLQQAGEDALREELKGYYESRKEVDAGSWVTALYHALYQSNELLHYLSE